MQGNDNAYSFFYRSTQESNESTAARDIASHLFLNVFPLMVGFQSSDALFHCSSVREVYKETSIVETQTINQPGGNTPALGGSLPGQCSLVAALYGDAENPTPSNRGRDFWGAFVEDQQSDGQWDLGLLGEVQVFYEEIDKQFTSPNNNTFELGIFSPTNAKKNLGEVPPVPELEVFWTIKVITLTNSVRTQRRRQHTDPCRRKNLFDPNA